MKRWNQGGIFCVGLTALALWLGTGCVSSKPQASRTQPVMLVVMDPLAKELACACVKGYGQRDYRKLAARLEAALKQPVSVEFSDDLAETLALAGAGQEVIVVGERSFVTHGAKQAGLKCRPVCELTDPDGDTTLTGSFVTRSDDPARELKDIGGRTVFFGLADSDENHTAAKAALRAAGVELSTEPERRAAYSDAALDVLDSKATPPPVAVIPGYALRLLEGCGSITPGDLRVIGKTQPAPFITVFVADNIPPEKEQKILGTLLDIKDDAKLLEAMESRDGFRPVNNRTSDAPQAGAADRGIHAASTSIRNEPSAKIPASSETTTAKPDEGRVPARSQPQRSDLDWPDWRGPGRDGHVPRLPPRLPATPKFVWKKAAMTGGLAGLSVSGGRLILAERDFGDEHDVYRCLNADDGELLWRIEFPARGQLDYGQFPRATPVIREGKAYLLGAFGDLRCVNVADGKVIWERHLPREFQAELPTWGMCSTPLVVDDLLIVNPGATNASLAALECATGRSRWVTPGPPAAYAAFICGEFGGRRQIVGYDEHSLGGWDVTTGERLWQLVPPKQGDFNVPTPIAVNGGVLVSTENNGTRLYRFDEAGRIIPRPVAESGGLAPDTATPVVTRGRVFGAHFGLQCLDLGQAMKPVWHRDDDALGDYATLIADDERVLVITLGGELILLDGMANECAIISRLRLFDDDVEVYSHPALVGTRIFVRGGYNVVCVDLGTD